MSRGISIDKEIKEYYYFFKDFKCEDKNKLDDVYSYTKGIVNKYLTEHEEILLDILEITHLKKNDVADMIFMDAWYHIYENICFLDLRYNIDEDIKTIKCNHEAGADSDNDFIDIISLKDYLKAKGYDSNQKRCYKDRISSSGKYMDYMDNYKIPKTCSVYTDYHSAYSETNQKYYLCKKYTDIADFFYAKKINKTDIKAKIKNYTIWDIDTEWLPVIAELYTSIQKGNQDIFQFQLVERLFKFRTLLHIYNNFSKEDYLEDMLFDVQPFTVFGYSVCMFFFMGKYNMIRQHDNEEEYAEFFFNGISYTIRMVLGKVLTTIWGTKTNEKKQQFIRNVKNECSEKQDSKSMLRCFNGYNYDIVDKIKNPEEFMNLYFCFLFNDKFTNSPNHRRTEEEILSFKKYIEKDDIDDSSNEDESELYKINLATYNNNIEGFFYSIDVEPNNDSDDESEESQDWIELRDSNDEEYEMCYDFGFSDLLYLVAGKKYKDFFMGNVDF